MVSAMYTSVANAVDIAHNAIGMCERMTDQRKLRTAGMVVAVTCSRTVSFIGAADMVTGQLVVEYRGL